MGAKRRGRSPSVADAEGEAGTGKSAKTASGKSLRFTLKKTPGTATKETTGDGGEDVTATGIDARDVSGAETTTGVGKLKLSVKMKLKGMLQASGP